MQQSLHFRHESTKHSDVHIMTNPVLEDHTMEQASETDFIYNYHNARLQFGMLFMNIVDAIREGDGFRLTRCYKLVILFAYKFKHTKYAYALLLLFVQTGAVLSEEESFCLIMNRFVNVNDKIGRNNPLDLHMEHLNLLPKRLFKGMGSNITTKSLQRAARSVVSINNVMEGIYKDCSKKKKSGSHGSKNPEEAVQIVVKDLLDGKVFQKTNGRAGYPTFPKFTSNVIDIDYRDFFKWTKDCLNRWKGVYETTKK